MVQKHKDRKPGIKYPGKPVSVVVTADESRVNTVLHNVLENALKYSAHQKRAVEVFMEPKEKTVQVLVRDHGEGIPEAELAKVFEPFYRVDKSRAKATGGYGLGLSLCREIMLAHGGDIRIQSTLGKGTEMTLIFPIDQDDILRDNSIDGKS